MAGEMYMTESAAGVTPYTHLRDDSNGQLWDRVNEEFTTEVSANVTNYNLDLTMIAPYRYHGDIPSGVPRGRYFLEYFTRTTGQNPAWDDDHKGTNDSPNCAGRAFCGYGVHRIRDYAGSRFRLHRHRRAFPRDHFRDHAHHLRKRRHHRTRDQDSSY